MWADDILQDGDLMLKLRNIGFENIDGPLKKYVIRSAGCSVGPEISWHEATIITRWLKQIADESQPVTIAEMYGEAVLWR